MKQINLLVLCGGCSAEHDISLVSTWNLLDALNEQFNCTLIAIDKQGKWYLQSISDFLAQDPNPNSITIPSQDEEILVQLGAGEQTFYNLETKTYLPKIDVVYPLLHGTNGEDGKVQGLLNLAQVPFIGCDVLGSAICMDKDIAKRLMIQANIPTSGYAVFYKGDDKPSYEQTKEDLGLPLFIKPANLGSSVGISKVSTEEEFYQAIEEAFQYDTKVLVEEFIDGIEVECAVLGNDQITVSQPGRYVHQDEFFDFDTKYLKNNEVGMEIPASFLTEEQVSELMELSGLAYLALECKGLARVDTFVTKDGQYFVNEINTLPGFTQNSMYPILMDKAGISYNDLVKQLCQLAIDRFQAEREASSYER